MTKKEFIERIAAQTGITKKDTEMMVDAITNTLADLLVAGDSIRLPNIGYFHTYNVKACERHNVLIGETRMYPAHRNVRLKPSKEMKERLKAGIE